MDTEQDRLKWLRKQANVRSMREAARLYDIGYELYKKIEKGERSLTKETALAIAVHHRVSPGWLLFGEGAPQGRMTVPVAGKIGAGQEMMLYENLGEGGGRAEASLASAAIAFEVEGDSMYPLARDHDVVFFGPEQREVTDLIGRECAVVLTDGRRFFKIIERGSRDGRFDLVSYNAATMRDQAVHSAGPLLGLKRRAMAGGRRRRP